MAYNHTLIAKGTRVVGDLYFSGELHVQGKVVGTIIADETAELEISQGGVVEGQIQGPKVIIRGSVNGDIHCYRHIELAPTAVINGNVYYNLLEMVKGAQVNGGLVFVAEEQQRKHLKAQRQQRSTA